MRDFSLRRRKKGLDSATRSIKATDAAGAYFIIEL